MGRGERLWSGQYSAGWQAAFAAAAAMRAVNLLQMLQRTGANGVAPGNLLNNMINYAPSSEKSFTSMALPAQP
jgi:hypothetical protein